MVFSVLADYFKQRFLCFQFGEEIKQNDVLVKIQYQTLFQVDKCFIVFENDSEVTL